MGIHIEEWVDLPYPGLMFCHNPPQEVFQIEPINDEPKEYFLKKKRNTNVMRVRDSILDAAEESGIDENWRLLENQLTRNTSINGKYLSNIINAPDGQYRYIH